MDSVAATDGHDIKIFLDALAQNLKDVLQPLEQQVRRLRELNGKGGVENVARGHSLMHKARVRPDAFAKIGQEG